VSLPVPTCQAGICQAFYAANNFLDTLRRLRAAFLYLTPVLAQACPPVYNHGISYQEA
jgi:hypothetical protein